MNLALNHETSLNLQLQVTVNQNCFKLKSMVQKLYQQAQASVHKMFCDVI